MADRTAGHAGVARRLLARWREAWGYADLVEQRRRFAARQLLGTRGAGLYRPRGSRVKVAVRHGRGDPFVLEEVWHSGDYLPPPGADALLSRRERVRVLDLGSHVGLFSAWMIDRYGEVSVVGFEPDPDNRRALLRTIRANAFEDRWSVVPACAGTLPGRTGFVQGLNGLSHVAGPGEEATVEVPVVDVLPHMAGADLVKIDIEGGEWAVLADERLADSRPPVMVLEWHSDPQRPHLNPKRRVVEALESLGYAVHHPPRYEAVPMDGPLWAAGVVWAWLPA